MILDRSEGGSPHRIAKFVFGALAQAIIASKTPSRFLPPVLSADMSLQLVGSNAVFVKRAKESNLIDEILKVMSDKVGGIKP